MSNANTKFGAKEVIDVTLYDIFTNKPIICFDTLKASSISGNIYARGGRGNHSISKMP